MGAESSNIKLSIIVPAYNATAFIRSCLESLQRQTLSEQAFEILVVNDGSTDGTPDLVAKIAKKQPNIRLINQANKGNGGARNTGIDNARGTYIYFLDADDYIADNTLEPLIDCAMANDLDMLGFKSRKVGTSNEQISKTTGKSDLQTNITTGTRFIGGHNYEAEVWWYFVKRTFLTSTGLRFFDRKFVQDSYITPTLFTQAHKVAFVEFDVHRYRMSENSITRNKSEAHLRRHFGDLIFAVTKLEALIAKLANAPLPDAKCIGMLRTKKERYVLITIVRFFKSSLPYKELLDYLDDFKRQNAYPFRYFPKKKGYNNPINNILVFICNRPFLLKNSFKLYRLIKK